MDNKEKAIRTEYEVLQREMQNPDVFGRTDYAQLAKRQGELAKIIGLFDDKKALESQKAETQNILNSSDAELAELARIEIEEVKEKLADIEQALSELLLPKDPNDEHDAVIEIRAAAGGDEASLFAGDLYRMYSRWSETHGYKTELVNESP